MGFAHFTLDLRTGNKSGNRVNNNNVDSTGTNESLGNFESLFAVIGLRNKQGVNVNAEVCGVNGIECVLRINECGFTAGFLSLGDSVQSERCFTGGFRSVYFHDSALGKSADTRCGVESQRSR